MKKGILTVLCIALFANMVGCGVGEGETLPAEVTSAVSVQIESATVETTPAETEPTETLPVETEPLETKLYLTHLSDECVASVELPSFVAEDEAVRNLIQDYVQSYFAGYFEDITLSVSSEPVSVTDGDHLYNFSVNCKATYMSDEFVSLVFEGVYYMRTAAHPVNLFFTLNIDRTTNERVLLKDVWLLNDDFYDTYLPYAEKALDARLGAEYQEEKDRLLEMYFSKDAVFRGLQTENECCAYYTETGMAISYPVNHALGDYLQAEIPYEDLGWKQMPYDAITKLETEVSLYDGRFTLICKNRHIWYRCLGLTGEVIDEGKVFREPRVTQINDHMVCFTLQTGTGKSTQWGFIYDGALGKQSSVYHWILDATEEKVVLGDKYGVTIRSIFDDTYIYNVNSQELDRAVDLAMEWIIDAELSEDGKTITITYVTAEDYAMATQEVLLE